MILANEEEARAFCAGLTDPAGMTRLERLATMVVGENARQNLMSKPSESGVWLRHLADSAQLLNHVPRENEALAKAETSPWLDLGTGAGFPGLVIAAMQPEREVVLVESRKKRVDWLRRAAAELGLAKCRVEGRRLEHVESFPAAVISARAFAPLTRLIGLSARFSTRHTHWLLPKGRSAVQEVASLPANAGEMFHVEHSVTDAEAGIVIGTGRPSSA
jgi:16S rRNA (guanine527-N7)-methyltransferase